MSNDVNIQNRKARHEYEFLETFTAGIILSGTEIKSIRESKASIAEAYCLMIAGELWIRSMRIDIYNPASHNNHDPVHDRKLLLNRTELTKLEKNLKNKGLTVIAYKLFLSDSGYAKLNIALAQGKKLHDKRHDLKTKDAKRDIDRAMKD
jgi:SsrA-binding protein